MGFAEDGTVPTDEEDKVTIYDWMGVLGQNSLDKMEEGDGLKGFAVEVGEAYYIVMAATGGSSGTEDYPIWSLNYTDIDSFDEEGDQAIVFEDASYADGERLHWEDIMECNSPNEGGCTEHPSTQP